MQVEPIELTKAFNDKHHFQVFMQLPAITDRQVELTDAEFADMYTVPIGVFASLYCAAQTALHNVPKGVKYVYDTRVKQTYLSHELKAVAAPISVGWSGHSR